jgi:hypothetical protein
MATMKDLLTLRVGKLYDPRLVLVGHGIGRTVIKHVSRHLVLA